MNYPNQFLIFAGTVLVVAIVGAILVLWLLRHFGMTDTTKSTEVIDCSMKNDQPFPIDGDIQIGTRKKVVQTLRFFYTVITLAYVATLFAPFWQVGIAGTILFGTGAIYCWRADWVQATISAAGINASRGYSVKLIPWSEIATCEVVTTYNTNGQFRKRCPVFKDAQGKLIFLTDFSLASQEDRDRLIDLVRVIYSPTNNETKTARKSQP